MPKKPMLWNTPDAAREQHVVPRRVRSSVGADYIPGYSEAVMANDLEKSLSISTGVKEKYYKRDFGTGPRILPVEFKWVRVLGPTGEASASANEDTFQYTKLGYQPVIVRSVEDWNKQFGEYGFGFPPAAQISPDGMIRRRDAALFYVDRETADRLEDERMEENARFLGNNQPNADANLPEPYDIVEEDSGSVSIGRNP